MEENSFEEKTGIHNYMQLQVVNFSLSETNTEQPGYKAG
jgi:hypothetical protein